MRLLIVEDSSVLRESLAEGLRAVGYAVDEAADGREGLWLAQSNPYDVIVLDLMLPGLDGLSVLQSLRVDKSDCGVLILTARDATADKVNGLRQGADDYLAKPFAFDELLARIESIIRRRHHQLNPTITLGPLILDTGARSAAIEGRRIELAPREYKLLEYLMRRSGQVVSRTDIEAHLYDQNAALMSNVVDRSICSLRQKITLTDGGQLIRTRRGMGYVLEEPA